MTAAHVVGAGLAGLAAALRLAEAGWPVTLHEAAPRPGGRCRSFHDPTLNRLIDNGNHILLSANRSALAYVRRIGSEDALITVEPAAFPFLDLRSGRHWCLRPTAGPLPWWMLAPGRRVPGSRIRDYLTALRLGLAGPRRTVADCVGRYGRLYATLWQPLTQAVVNADAEEAAARLLWRVLATTLLRGERHCRPMLARDGLSAALVAPAVERIGRLGGTLRLGSRLSAAEDEGGRIARLVFSDGIERVRPSDVVVLAAPPGTAAALLPGLAVPRGHRAIVNAHFRLDQPAALPGGQPFLGLIGGVAQWLFVRGDVLSITVSAADRLLDRPVEAVAARLWKDAARALGRDAGPMPPWRIIKERRATFAPVPDALPYRPGARTRWPNLFLAGDWTATGLPATIEGSILSGDRAAALALAAGRGPTEKGLDS